MSQIKMQDRIPLLQQVLSESTPFPRFAIAQGAAEKYINNIVVATFSTDFAVAHELGHLLTNAGHKTPSSSDLENNNGTGDPSGTGFLRNVMRQTTSLHNRPVFLHASVARSGGRHSRQPNPMTMMKSKSFHSAVAGAAFLPLVMAVMAADLVPPQVQLPPHYHEVAAIMGGAAKEPFDPGYLEAREKVAQLGDEALPALMVMFNWARTDSFRVSIMSAMLYTKIDRKKAVDFLLPQIPEETNDWRGKEEWIAAGVTGICDADPERGLPLARKALTSSHAHLKAMAVRALGKVGGEEDLKLLNEEWDRHGRGSLQAGDHLPGRLHTAIEQISKRLEAAQGH